MKAQQQLPNNDPKFELFSCLDSAYGSLVSARKLAALSKHLSFKKIGKVIEALEKIFEKDFVDDSEEIINSCQKLS